MENEGEDTAARAFDDLRAEVSLVRRAVERLTAERVEVADRPDYSETLGTISQSLAETAQQVGALAQSSGLTLTPETIARQIVAAGRTVRTDDHRALMTAKQGLDELASKLGHHLHSNIQARKQRHRLQQTGVIGLALGMILWASLAGPIARVTPGSWLWPERMAARTMRLPMWEGGQRLMQAGNDRAYAAVLAGYQVTLANRDALALCSKQAAKANRAVRCTIQVKAKD